MEIIKKEKTKAFNKNIYLLGVNKEGKKVWLEQQSWDCGWYWGFGYLETYTNNDHPELAFDICEHTHFDYEFFNKSNGAFDAFVEYFKNGCVLDGDGIWLLCDYMATFYALQEALPVFQYGHSNFTERAKIEKFKNDNIAQSINNIIFPVLFEKILALLTPEK